MPTRADTTARFSLLPWGAILAFAGSHGWWLVMAALALPLGRLGWRWLAERRQQARRLDLLRRASRQCRQSSIFYATDSRIERLTAVESAATASLLFRFESLDYDASSPYLTRCRQTAVPIGLDQFVAAHRLGRRLDLPERLRPGQRELLKRLPPGDDRHELARRQHDVWRMISRLQSHEAGLQREIRRLDERSVKYVDHAQLPQARQQLQDLRRQRLATLEEIRSSLQRLGGMLERLTLSLESLEDLGCLLGASTNPAAVPTRIDQTPSSSGAMDMLQRDLEEARLLLNSAESTP